MRKQLLYLAGAVVAICVTGLAMLPFLVDVNHYRGLIQSQLETKLKRKVTLGTITLRRFPLAVEVKDVVISEDPAVGGTLPFATAKSIVVRPSVLALLRHDLEVSSLILDRPSIEVIRNSNGTWNFSTIGGTSNGKSELSIDDLDLRDGVIAFTDIKAKQPRAVYDDIDVHLQNFSAGQEFKLYAAAHLPPGRFDFQGTGRDSGAVAGKITMKDVQISSLTRFLNAPGIEDSEGILNGSANIDINPGNAAAKGEIGITNAKAGKHVIDFPISLAFDVTENRGTELLELKALQAKLGGNSFGVTGQAELHTSPAVLHFKADQLKGSLTELAHVGALLGFVSTPGLIMKGTLDGNVSIEGRADRPALNGHLEITNFEATSSDWKQPVKAPTVRLDFDPNSVRAAPAALTCGGTQLTARGVVTGYTTEDARVEADVKTSSATLDELLNITAAVGVTKGLTGHGAASVDIHASGSARNPNLGGLVSLDNATLNLPTLAKPLTVGHLNMKFADNSAAIDNLAIQLGGANLTGTASVRNFAAPQVTFAINADKLDVAQLQAIESNSKSKGPSLINKVSAKGTLTAGQLISNGIVLTQLKTTVNLDHGIASLAPLSAGMFTGTVSGSIQSDLKSTPPTYKTALKLNQVDANALFSAVTPLKGVLFGRLTSDGALSFTGTTEEKLTKSLNGTLNLRLSQGRLMGVNMMNEVGRIGKFLGITGNASNFTKINLLTAALEFQDGNAHASAMKLETDGASVAGGGNINIVNQGLDLRLIASLDKDMTARAGGSGIGGIMVTALSDGNGSIVVPVHVAGTINQPRVSPDAEKFAQMKLQMLKNPAEAVIGILGRIGGKKKPDDGKQ